MPNTHLLLVQGLVDKHIPVPAVRLVDLDLAHEPVVSQLGQDLGPDDPVDAAEGEDAPGDDVVRPVGHALVDAVVAVGRRRVGDEDEEEVADEEEDDDGEGGLDGRVPAPGVALDVEPDEADGDEGVDDGEGVGDEAGHTMLADIRETDGRGECRHT